MDRHQPSSADSAAADGPLSGIAWSLVLGLGALALLRPLVDITGAAGALDRPFLLWPATAVLVTVTWVAAVVVTRVPRPLLTLVCTGLAHAVFSIVVSAVLSPVMLGELRGPLTHPFGFVAALALNALWGLVAGVIALGGALGPGRSPAKILRASGPYPGSRRWDRRWDRRWQPLPLPWWPGIPGRRADAVRPSAGSSTEGPGRRATDPVAHTPPP